jgi:hypothetical protein
VKRNSTRKEFSNKSYAKFDAKKRGISEPLVSYNLLDHPYWAQVMDKFASSKKETEHKLNEAYGKK